MKAYPIKFEPILKEKIWGGTKLKEVLNKKTTCDRVGESWEISAVKGSISKVKNGEYIGFTIVDLLKMFKKSFLGRDNYERFGNEFPLLIKFLDANRNLSVQVHPDDKMARKKHNSFGKTEMWYIMGHDKDAKIIVGLKNHVKKKSDLAKVCKKNVYDILNSYKVAKGDAYFIPAGQVHAIGAGVLAAEIQQTSDITYRLYDWDRKNEQGVGRELHIDNAIRATKKKTASSRIVDRSSFNTTTEVVNSNFFTTNSFRVYGSYKKDYTHRDSFIILLCTEGLATISVNGITEVVEKGETVLLPASTENAYLFSKTAQFLEVFISEPVNRESSSACGKKHLAVAS